ELVLERQRLRVHDDESRRGTLPKQWVRGRQVDSRTRDVRADDVISTPGEEMGEPARAAAAIEHARGRRREKAEERPRTEQIEPAVVVRERFADRVRAAGLTDAVVVGELAGTRQNSPQSLVVSRWWSVNDPAAPWTSARVREPP